MTSGFGGRLDASYPTDVRNGGGIGVTKQGLATRLAIDLRNTQRLSTIPANGLVPVQDPLTGLIGALPVTALPTAQTGDGSQTNVKLATMPARTFKANLLSTTAPPQDVNFAQVLEALGITSGGSVATNATNVSVVPPASQSYTNVQGAITSIEGRIGSGNGAITSNSIGDATPTGKAVLTGNPTQGRSALALGTSSVLNVGVPGGVPSYDDPRFAAIGGIQPGAFDGVANQFLLANNPDNVTWQYGPNAGESPSALRVGIGGAISAAFYNQGSLRYPLISGILGTAKVPANTNMTGHACALSGFVQNFNPVSYPAAVALYGQAEVWANNAHAWGFNTVSTDNGFATPGLWGGEIDVNCHNPGTLARGLDIVGGSTVQFDQVSPGLFIQSPGVFYKGSATPIRWGRGIQVDDESSYTGIEIGSGLMSASASLPLMMAFRRPGGGREYGLRQQVTQDGHVVMAAVANNGYFKISTVQGGTNFDPVTIAGNKLGINCLPGLPLDVNGSARVAGDMTITGAAATGASLAVGGGFAMAGGAPVGKQSITGNITGDINGVRNTVISLIAAMLQFNMATNNTN